MMDIIIKKPVKICDMDADEIEEAKNLIENKIIETQIMVSTSKDITDEQIKATVNLILSDYSDYSVEDVQRCLTDGVKGLHGEIFRFDTNTICSWLSKHGADKAKLKATLPAPLRPEQVANLKKWQENKVKEPAKPMEIMKATGCPPEIKEKLTEMFKKQGIKNPFEKNTTKEGDYKWPEPKDDFEKQCIAYFTEKWEQQGKEVLRKQNKPYIMHDGLMYNPDTWLTFCYDLKMKSSKEV